MASVIMDTSINNSRPRSSSFASVHADQTKRARAGSISGRLRTASDLADWGWINSNEKALVKDLIIADDAEVNAAIEKYQTDGDIQTLSAIVKNPQKRRLSIGKCNFTVLCLTFVSVTIEIFNANECKIFTLFYELHTIFNNI